MGVNVRVVENTKLAGMKALADRIARLGRAQVLVGIPEGKTEADGTSLALVAAVNEFGSADGRIPERPAFRRGLGSAGARAAYRRLNQRNLKRVADGTMDGRAALGQLGLLGVSLVQREIRDGHFTPNAPSTIARKGSDKPLVDSGQLIGGISFKIEGAT
jgi:hypothetical protein